MKKDSWLYSDSFLKRCFAFWGYAAVANLIISIPFMILWMLFAVVFFTTMGPAMRGGPDMQNIEGMENLPPEIRVQIQNELRNMQMEQQ